MSVPSLTALFTPDFKSSEAPKIPRQAKKFGEITEIHRFWEKRPDNSGRDLMVEGICSCGNFWCGRLSDLKRKDRLATKSCGCLTGLTGRKKVSTLLCSLTRTRHGLKGHRLYDTYKLMHHRVLNPNNMQFHNYGGREIKICEEFLSPLFNGQWRLSPDKFMNYVTYIEALADAYRYGYSVDRIDNDDDYKVGNLRWADAYTQSTNKQCTIRLINPETDEEKPLIEWCRIFNKPYGTILKRWYRGITDFKLLFSARYFLETYDENSQFDAQNVPPSLTNLTSKGKHPCSGN